MKNNCKTALTNTNMQVSNISSHYASLTSGMFFFLQEEMPGAQLTLAWTGELNMLMAVVVIRGSHRKTATTPHPSSCAVMPPNHTRCNIGESGTDPGLVVDPEHKKQ